MRALSIKQPWLWAITDLDKRIENRTWKPPRLIIGQTIALHASKIDDTAGYEAVREISGKLPPVHMDYGAIVATAKVDGWIDGTCWRDDKWFFGPFGWILDDVKAVPPVPCRGALGLWDVPQAVMVLIAQHLAEAC